MKINIGFSHGNSFLLPYIFCNEFARFHKADNILVSALRVAFIYLSIFYRDFYNYYITLISDLI